VGGGLPALGAEDIAGGEGCGDEEAVGGLLEGYWEVVSWGGAVLEGLGWGRTPPERLLGDSLWQHGDYLCLVEARQWAMAGVSPRWWWWWWVMLVVMLGRGSSLPHPISAPP